STTRRQCMGSIYARGSKLWLSYRDYDGKWCNRSSRLDVGQEEQARELLCDVEAKVEAHARAGGVGNGPVPLGRFVESWLADRRARGVLAEKDERSLADTWIMPALGEVLLTELRPRHVRDFLRELRGKKSARGTLLAPKTVRGAYMLLKRMLEDAK